MKDKILSAPPSGKSHFGGPQEGRDSQDHKALKIRATHMTLYATMTYNH